MKSELKELKTNEAEVYSILSPEPLSYNELPRKIKKQLKRKLHSDMPMWRMNEIKISMVAIDRWHQRKQIPDFRRYFIMSYGLGARG